MSAQANLEAAQRAARLIPTDELYPAPWNPRTITDERLRELRRSMDADPGHLWARPLMVREDGMVIGGNHRLLASRLDPPYTGLPGVDMHGLSDDEAKLIALRDNENYAVWEDDKVAEILAGLDIAGLDLSLSGFSTDALTSLLDGFKPPEETRKRDPDEAPNLPNKPRSKLGQVYELGQHRVLCGDSRDGGLMAKLMGGEKAQMMFTDPPYGKAYQVEMTEEDASRLNRRTDGKVVANDALSKEDTRALIVASMTTARELMRQGASFYVCAPGSDMLQLFMEAMADAGLPARHPLVWVKDRFAFGQSDFHYRHEHILYGWRQGRAHFFVNDRTLDSVWEVARPTRSPEHPTMKPVALVERALAASSKRGWSVLDPFGGSGSTLIACEQLGRRCFTAELEPGYVDVIRDRYERFVAA